MRLDPRCPLGLVVFLLAMSASEATAQQVEPPPPETAQVQEDARIDRAGHHFDQGLALVRRENWEAALTEFEESMRLYPTSVAQYNQGLCLKYLHRYLESIAVLERYLDRWSAEIDDTRRSEVRAMIGEMRVLLTSVMIRVNVEGAAIEIDGREVGRSPMRAPVLLVSGPHELLVQREGYRRVSRTIRVVAGGEQVEQVELLEVERSGRLRVEANLPGAVVWVDGEEVGTAPYDEFLPEGEHELSVVAEGYRESSQRVLISNEDDRIVSLTLESTRLHRGWFWSMVGLTALGALTTTGLGLAVHLLDAEYDPRATDSNAQYDRGHGLIIGTDVSLGLSCLSAAVALVIAFFTDFHPGEALGEAPSARALPWRLSMIGGER